MGKQWKQWDTLFSRSPKSVQIVTAAMKLQDACFLGEKKKNFVKCRQYIKKQRHYFADKGPYRQSNGFTSSYIWMWDLDHKESWVPKDWCFWTVVLEKAFESLLDCKEIKPVNQRKWVLNIHCKDRCWHWSSNTLVTRCKELTHCRRPWCWERLKAGGEGDNRGWDSWMASLTG